MNKDILIIRFSSIGDIVMALPVAHAIKELYGESCKVIWMTKKIYGGLVENNEFIDEVLYFEDFRNNYFRVLKEIVRNYNKYFSKEEMLGPVLFPSILKILPSVMNKRKFDLVIDLQGGVESSIISMMSSKFRLIPGFIDNGIQRFYVKIKGYDPLRHRVQDNLDVVRFLGYRGEDIKFGWRFTLEEKKNFENLCVDNGIKKNDKYIVCVIRTTWRSKNYPLENWVRIIKYLNDNNKKVIIIGGKEEKIAAEKLEEIIGRNNRLVNLAAKISLRELIMVVKNCSLVITGDTGPMHIAASLNKFIIALMGPTDPIKYGPYCKKNKLVLVNHICRGCNETVCPKGMDCLGDIVPEKVIEIIREYTTVEGNI